MADYSFAALKSQYRDQWDSMATDPSRAHEFAMTANALLKNKAVYQAVSAATGVPVVVIMVIHERECGARFDQHLHNGDPLSARTYHVPAGRPPAPLQPPFKWFDSAVDALRLEGAASIADWSVERACDFWEAYNGEGYRLHGEPSPYVWGGSNIERAGKYTSDNHFDPEAVDSQPGCAPLMAAIVALDPSLSLPRADVAPVPLPHLRPALIGAAVVAAAATLSGCSAAFDREPNFAFAAFVVLLGAISLALPRRHKSAPN